MDSEKLHQKEMRGMQDRIEQLKKDVADPTGALGREQRSHFDTRRVLENVIEIAQEHLDNNPRG